MKDLPMPRDAHDHNANSTPVLPDLLATTAMTIAPLRTLLAIAKDCVRKKVMVDGHASGTLVEAEQTATHGLAWLATY
ncbi:MAG: (2S)-methylsuccinyl-CoA dehydrogenase, partial [Octadecabacter sp.]